MNEQSNYNGSYDPIQILKTEKNILFNKIIRKDIENDFLANQIIINEIKSDKDILIVEKLDIY